MTSENKEAALKLADELISCQLPEDDIELKNIVSVVQRHKHTPSCLKYDGVCRYGFPRLPSPRTLLAEPIDPELDEKEKTKKKNEASKILSDARNFLNSLGDSDIDMTLDEFYTAIGTNEDKYVEA